jgi:hypothetical protein
VKMRIGDHAQGKMQREQNPDPAHQSKHEFSSDILQDAPGKFPRRSPAEKCSEDRC